MVPVKQKVIRKGSWKELEYLLAIQRGYQKVIAYLLVIQKDCMRASGSLLGR